MMNLWWSTTVAMAVNCFCEENHYDLGTKVWALNNTVGILIEFEVYQRRSIARENSPETDVYVSAASLIRFL